MRKRLRRSLNAKSRSVPLLAKRALKCSVDALVNLAPRPLIESSSPARLKLLKSSRRPSSSKVAVLGADVSPLLLNSSSNSRRCSRTAIGRPAAVVMSARIGVPVRSTMTTWVVKCLATITGEHRHHPMATMIVVKVVDALATRGEVLPTRLARAIATCPTSARTETHTSRSMIALVVAVVLATTAVAATSLAQATSLLPDAPSVLTSLLTTSEATAIRASNSAGTERRSSSQAEWRDCLQPSLQSICSLVS